MEEFWIVIFKRREDFGVSVYLDTREECEKVIEEMEDQMSVLAFLTWYDYKRSVINMITPKKGWRE